MCGISGIISFGRSQLNLLELNALMNQRIRHRGPDDEGFVAFSDQTCSVIGSEETLSDSWNSSFPYSPNKQIKESISENFRLVLGHRRLSIIDLSPEGHQPLCDQSGRYWIVFNGAIYNYYELRSELNALGHSFFSATDTEVLLHSYMEWGTECVKKFIGMWSFVIYDKVENILFASRDRTGVKPFYYNFDKHYFSFASEIKAFLDLPFINKEINNEAVFDYLILGKCEDEEKSIYEGILELFPGNNLQLDIKKGKIKKWKYYNNPLGKDWKSFNETLRKNLESELKDLLEDSIRLHLRADVKIGACLSGGLDSSLITAMISDTISNLPVFTVTSLGEKEDESFYAKLLVDKYNLSWCKVNPSAQELFDNFEELCYCQDLPIKGANTFTHFQLMKAISEQGVKVTIDGQGADELFAGYSQYYVSYLGNAFINGAVNILFNSLMQPSNEFASRKEAILFPFYKLSSELITHSLTASLYKARHPEFKFINNEFWNTYSYRIEKLKDKLNYNLNETLYKDFHGSNFKTMLRAGDRNAMYFGIESRMPFADDYRIEEFALSVPAVYKIRNNISKALLRDVSKHWIPKEVYSRKDKKGFSVPEKKWLLDIGEKIYPYFDNSLSPYLNIDSIKKEWIAQLLSCKNSQRLWRMWAFAGWMKSVK